MFHDLLKLADRLIVAIEKTADAVQKMADRAEVAKLPTPYAFSTPPAPFDAQKAAETVAAKGLVYLCLCGRVNREPSCKCGRKEPADFITFKTVEEAEAHIKANPPAAPATKPAKVTKPKKPSAAPAADIPTPEAPVAPVAAADPKGAASTAPATSTDANVPGMDEIRAGISKVMALRGKEVGKRIVVEIGNSQTVSLISKENLPAVWAAIQEELKA